jgi:hypothetical protein
LVSEIGCKIVENLSTFFNPKNLKERGENKAADE